MQQQPGLPHVSTGTVSQMFTQTQTCTHTHMIQEYREEAGGSGNLDILFINAQLLRARTSVSQGSYCTTLHQDLLSVCIKQICSKQIKRRERQK